MAMKVIVIDSAQLPAGAEFPPLEVEKYGWEQYPQLDEEEIADRCWRADILVSLSTAIGRPVLEKLDKLSLLIVAGEACNRLDQDAAQERGVELLAFPDANLRDVGAAQELCGQVSAAINHYLRHK